MGTPKLLKIISIRLSCDLTGALFNIELAYSKVAWSNNIMADNMHLGGKSRDVDDVFDELDGFWLM